MVCWRKTFEECLKVICPYRSIRTGNHSQRTIMPHKKSCVFFTAWSDEFGSSHTLHKTCISFPLVMLREIKHVIAVVTDKQTCDGIGWLGMCEVNQVSCERGEVRCVWYQTHFLSSQKHATPELTLALELCNSRLALVYLSSFFYWSTRE